MKPTLKLAHTKSVHERAMDDIERSWAAWHGPNGEPWNAYDGPTEPWAHKVSAAVEKGTYRVAVDGQVSWWRRLLRWRQGVD